jgi:hypothetical protein
VPGLGQQPLKSVRGTERGTVRASVAAPPILLGPGGRKFVFHGRVRGQKREFCMLLAIEREAPGAGPLACCTYYVRCTEYKDAVLYRIRRNDTGAR